MPITAAGLRTTAKNAVDLAHRCLAAVGVRQSSTQIVADAQAYWERPRGTNWKAHSHWENGVTFDGNRLWDGIGRRHVALYEKSRRALGGEATPTRVLEWGCGGGANAVHFAPLASEYVGVEVSAETLDECARQVRSRTEAPFVPVRIDVAHPEAALAALTEPIDLFLCFYVFELLPSQEYGARVLRIAERCLRPGGMAIIQMKYDDGRWTSRSRRRAYRLGLADMTTYRIERFWALLEQVGLSPQSIHLAPRGELDDRYAYFVATKGS